MTNYDRLGKMQERAICRWLREHGGFTGADRIVRTGAGKDYEHRADEGDIWAGPGVIVQSKRLSPPNRAERQVPKWLAETEAQREVAGADVGLLIVRREGTTDVGEWWCFQQLQQLCRLLERPPVDGLEFLPTRLLVRDAIRLVRAAGYGSPLMGGEAA